MPKHKIRNVFLCHIKKEKTLSKNLKNSDLKTSSRPFCLCKELSTTSIGK